MWPVTEQVSCAFCVHFCFSLCVISKYFLWKRPVSDRNKQFTSGSYKCTALWTSVYAFCLISLRATWGPCVCHFLLAGWYDGLRTVLFPHPGTVNQKLLIPVILNAAARLFPQLGERWTDRQTDGCLRCPFTNRSRLVCWLFPSLMVVVLLLPLNAVETKMIRFIFSFVMHCACDSVCFEQSSIRWKTFFLHWLM